MAETTEETVEETTDEIVETVEDESGVVSPETAGEIEDIVDEAVDEALDEADGNNGETDIDIDQDIDIHEAPEIPETSYVDVGDLHISGPPEMVERVTQKYLKDHIDHNPHDGPENPVETLVESTGDVVEETADVITPEPVQEEIAEQAGEEISTDIPPNPTDWLFKKRWAS